MLSAQGFAAHAQSLIFPGRGTREINYGRENTNQPYSQHVAETNSMQQILGPQAHTHIHTYTVQHVK